MKKGDPQVSFFHLKHSIMKKVLFITLALAVGMTGFAQIKSQPVKAEKGKVGTANIYKKAYNGINEAPIMSFAHSQVLPSNPSRETEYPVDCQTMLTYYDLQSNGFVANRMHHFDDGTVGLVATYGQNTNWSDRGTGYDYYNGSEFIYDIENNPMPGRIETEKTGWPCYTQYGPEGEIVISHAAFGTNNCHLTYYTREKKGEGDWQGPFSIPNPTDLGTTVNLMSWPKIATSGPDHNIIHVLGADQDEDNLADSYLYYSRSTDGENWTTTFVPTLEDWEHTIYGSDYYSLAANGDNVAILLLDMMGHGLVIKSTDNGETWEKIKFWDNPYAGLDWETDPNSLFDDDNTMYGPETGAIAIDNNGMVHGVFSSHNYYHAELGTSYNFYHGKGIDGIFYWNESMGTLVAPEWVCPDDGTVIPSNPHNCFRMWWPYDGNGDYVTRNFESSNLIGFINVDDYTDMENDNIYCEQDYYQFWQACSVLPVCCIDESGVVAVGYSCPDAHRMSNNNKYLRSIYVTFIEAPYRMADHFGEYTEEFGDIFYNWVKLQDADEFMHSYDEAIATICPQNTTNMDFWFGYQADDTPGFYVGNNSTQTSATDNYIWATLVKPNIEGLTVEEQVAVTNTKMEVYPNPAVNQLNVRLENDAEIAVFNIMGQNVLNLQGVKGVNTININDLTSGVYFISAGTATQKFIVK